VIVAVLLFALSPQFAGAQATGSSTVIVAHPTLALGQTETLTIVARDLAGRPLPNASVSLAVRFGSHTATYHLKKTDSSGRTTLSLHAPSGMSSGKIPVLVTISSGFLRQTVAARFALSTKAAAPRATATTATPTVPTATATASASGLAVSASALPPHVVAPNPVYVVVNARSHGVDQPAAAVTVEASFKEGKFVATGTTDAYGVATVKIDTARARVDEVVKVVASVTWKGATSHGSTAFDLASPPASPTPTPTSSAPLAPTFFPTATSGPTSTPGPVVLAPVPVPSSIPTDTPTGLPTATSYPTPTPYPTATDYPTPTAYPTYTPVPTDTPQPTSTSTPFPTYTATPTPMCPGSQTGCMQAMLNIINSTRAQYGLYPLVMNTTQSNGTSSCAGSYGHSKAMAQSGGIWHTNSSYPAASFPNNICVGTSSAGENVGQYSSGNELGDLQQIHNLMMNEAHDAATCSTQINHACNIMTTSFHQVGIGIYFDANRTWLTEDFLT
jgi:uncharacterized protein YkwD